MVGSGQRCSVVSLRGERGGRGAGGGVGAALQCSLAQRREGREGRAGGGVGSALQCSLTQRREGREEGERVVGSGQRCSVAALRG